MEIVIKQSPEVSSGGAQSFASQGRGSSLCFAKEERGQIYFLPLALSSISLRTKSPDEGFLVTTLSSPKLMGWYCEWAQDRPSNNPLRSLPS